MNLNRILIVRLSALGDVTLVLAVIRTLQEALPQAQISWLTSRAVYPLLEGIEGIEFIVIDKPKGPRDYLALRRLLRQRRFDVLLAMQASLRANLIYPLIKAPRKIGFDYQRARDGQWLFTNERIASGQPHLLDSFFAFIETLGVTQRSLHWDLPLLIEARQWAASIVSSEQPLLVINPGASKSERNWLVPRYIETIHAAQQHWQVQVILTGGPSDAEAAVGRAIETELGNLTNLIGKTTPKQLAALLARADCLLAPDTGPVHIAVAMGTPVVGLYAVAPASLSGPYLYPHLVVDKYAEAVTTLLHKDPHQVKWGTRVHHPDAMALITVDEVLVRLEQVFETQGA